VKRSVEAPDAGVCCGMQAVARLSGPYDIKKVTRSERSAQDFIVWLFCFLFAIVFVFVFLYFSSWPLSTSRLSPEHDRWERFMTIFYIKRISFFGIVTTLYIMAIDFCIHYLGIKK
jgi:hypothetical protein